MKEKIKPSRIIAIDYGMARIGLAISDENKLIALPMSTMKTERKSADTITKLLTEFESRQKASDCDILEVVVGLPLLMSGKKGLLADEVHHFVSLLKEKLSIPIQLWDERLSSVQAEKAMREGNMTRKKRAQSSDSVAALIILQSYLDYLTRPSLP